MKLTEHFTYQNGALGCTEAIPDLTQKLNVTCTVKFYGTSHFICETITEKAARTLANVLEAKYFPSKD